MGAKFNTDEIRLRNPLQTTIEKLTGQTFKKRGNWQFIKCPLHTEKTASFHLKESDPDFWLCEGCRKCGDVIAFVIHFKKVDFVEACRILGASENEKLDPAEALRLKAERERERLEKLRLEEEEQERARAAFHASGKWQTLHKQLTPAGRLWFNGRGVDDDWIDFWELGEEPDLYGHGVAYSLPYRHPADFSRMATVQYRYLVPNGVKYLFESGLGKPAFITRPDLDTAQNYIVNEGGFKAMNTAITLGGQYDDWQVVGQPDKYHLGGLLPRLKAAKRVILVPDPDAMLCQPNENPDGWVPWPVRHIEAIGPHALILRWHTKFDDWLLAEKPTAADLMDLFRMQARRY